MTAIAATAVVPAGAAQADSFRDDQWYLGSLKVQQAQSVSKGAGVTVAVVDTGVYPHPDLRRNLLVGKNFSDIGAGDGRGDKVGHGTNMAAIIAGHGRAGNDGVLGIAPASRILPVRINNDVNNVPTGALAQGINWATQNGAEVINVSSGTGPAFELQSAVRSAIDSDVVVVAAAGNTAKAAIISYPAAMDGVLAVGATARNGQHASLSVKSAKIQICAPGVEITTAQPEDEYVDTNGTSPATAIVSGAAALVRAKFPQLSGPEVIHRLTATADDVGPAGRDDECGFGELNLVKALTADVPPLTAATATTSPPPTPSSDATTIAATPEPHSPGSTTIGWIAGVLAVGAFIGYLVVRRRRKP